MALGCQDATSARPPVAEKGTRTPAEASFKKQLERLGQEGWYGIYMMGQKVGHGHLWFRPTRPAVSPWAADAGKPAEPGAYTYGFEMKMSVSGGAEANELTLSEYRYYAKDYPHALIETRFGTGAKGFIEERTATPTADGRMQIVRTLSGKAEPARDVPGTKEDLVAQLRLSPLELIDTEVGTRAEVSLWSWEKEADEAIAVSFDGIDKRQRAGISERVGRFTLTYKATGVSGAVLVGSDGTLLEMTLGASLLMKLEERSVAESGIAGLDILGTGVASPARLGSPDAVSGLVLELTGPKGLKLPTSSVRKVEAIGVEGRFRLTNKRGLGDAVTPAERTEALMSDATLDATHPTIVQRAGELTRGLATPGEKVRAIADWVFRTLDKKLATHLPTASTVLDKKVGDCTEHTWLTVALARAAGIPARPLYGLAYTGDGESIFAYHAWVEVAVPDATGVERWLAIDPTWGEAEADATHIVLGSSLGEVAGSIGGLKIESATVLP